jgi:hypothetical protein
VSDSEYRERLVNAIKTLETIRDLVKPSGGRDGEMNAHFEKQRLTAKIDGVKLALAYYDEYSEWSNNEL